MLFTADLRAFSERLVAKTETVEVKQEIDDAGEEVEVAVARKTAIKEKKIKRELEEADEQQVEVSSTTTKKRRTTRNSMGAF